MASNFRHLLCSLCKKASVCSTFCLAPLSAYAVDTYPKTETTAPDPIKNVETKGRDVENLSPKSMTASGVEHIQVKGTHEQTLDSVSGVDDNTINRKADLGPMGNIKLAKAPFSVMKTPHSVIMNQQLRNIDDTIEYQPSVHLDTVTDPAQSRMMNRGFESDTITNSRIDGMNALLITPYATEQFQNVTILNGMAGAIYGPQNPAGTIDFRQKRPTDSPYFNFNFNYDANGGPMESLDASSGRLGPVSARLNMLNQSGSGYVSGSSMWRDMIMGNFDIKLTKKTTLQLDAGQYSEGLRGYPGYFSFAQNVQLPDAPSMRHSGYGQKSSGGDYSMSMGDAKLIHQFNDKWSIRFGTLYQDTGRNVFNTLNNITEKKGQLLDTQTISTAANGEEFQLWSNSAYLNGEFNTGSLFGQKITHHINLGSNGYDEDNIAPQGVQGDKWSQTTGFYDPRQDPDAGRSRKYGSRKSFTVRDQSLIAGDMIDIGKYVSIMTELSWGWITEKNYGQDSKGSKAVHLTQDQHTTAAFSPSAAIVFHPHKNLNLYFNWGRSIQQGSVVGSEGARNYNQILAPIRSEQFEGGIKWTYKNRLQLNLAGFSMNRPYAYYDPTYYCNKGSNCGLEGYFGNQTEQGVEFQASGKLTRDLSVLGGFTWLHSSLGDVNTSAYNKKGKLTGGMVHNARAVGVPEWAANVMLDYKVPLIRHAEFLHGLAFNSNVHFVGRRAADISGFSHVDSYVTLNLGARYAYKIKGHMMVLRLNVQNVNGERYWQSVFAKGPSSGSIGRSNTTATAGMPRTWSFSSSVYF